VSKLKVAWILHTGDISDGHHGKQRSGFETTPILVDATLFFTTGFNRVMAIDPVNGKLKWSYDPKIDLVIAAGGHPKIAEEDLSDALIAFSLP
jgi:quinoprotein glucose dehydrogenase